MRWNLKGETRDNFVHDLYRRTVQTTHAVNQQRVMIGKLMYHACGPSAGPPAPGGGGAIGMLSLKVSHRQQFEYTRQKPDKLNCANAGAIVQ
jgi:hypothetical protein